MKYRCTHCTSSELRVEYKINHNNFYIFQVCCICCKARGSEYREVFHYDFEIPKELCKVMKVRDRLQYVESGEKREKLFQKYLERIMKLQNGMLP